MPTPTMRFSSLHTLNENWQVKQSSRVQVKKQIQHQINLTNNNNKKASPQRFRMFTPDTFKKTGCGCGK